MNDEQYKFYCDVRYISPSLADWIKAKFEAGFSLQEVKLYIKEAAKVAGKD